MPDVEKLADAAEVIVQGYAFIDSQPFVTSMYMHAFNNALTCKIKIISGNFKIKVLWHNPSPYT